MYWQVQGDFDEISRHCQKRAASWDDELHQPAVNDLPSLTSSRKLSEIAMLHHLECVAHECTGVNSITVFIASVADLAWRNSSNSFPMVYYPLVHLISKWVSVFCSFHCSGNAALLRNVVKSWANIPGTVMAFSFKVIFGVPSGPEVLFSTNFFVPSNIHHIID